jgi:hypothetical protein
MPTAQELVGRLTIDTLSECLGVKVVRIEEGKCGIMVVTYENPWGFTTYDYTPWAYGHFLVFGKDYDYLGQVFRHIINTMTGTCAYYEADSNDRLSHWDLRDSRSNIFATGMGELDNEEIVDLVIIHNQTAKKKAA